MTMKHVEVAEVAVADSHLGNESASMIAVAVVVAVAAVVVAVVDVADVVVVVVVVAVVVAVVDVVLGVYHTLVCSGSASQVAPGTKKK